MTVSSSLNKVRYEGNGVTTVFSFSFPVLAVTDLQVYSIVRATGVATLLSYGTHYTAVKNTGTEGGSVTMLSAPDTLTDVFIKRVVSVTQGSEFPPESELPEKSFENGLDKAMMAIQQVDERVGRALLFPDTSMTGDKFLPEPETGKALEWGADGNIVNSTASLSGTLAGAQAAQTAAEIAQANAELAEVNAETAKINAELAEANAETAQAAAEAARDTTVNFVNRGVWLDTTAYTVGNLVGYTKADGRFGTYMALQTHTNQNPETSSGYWVLVAQDGVSEIQFRKDITFSATFDTVQEMKDNGMITNYTSPSDPLLFPATSSNAYQFAQANIIAGGKFGKCLDFTQTAKSLLLPEKNVDLSKEFSISFWLKSPAVINTSLIEHTSRALQIMTSSSGTLRAQTTNDSGTSRTATGTTNLASGTAWHHCLIVGKLNSGTTDFLKVYVDGVQEGSQITGTSMVCSGLDTGKLILGAGYRLVSGQVIDQCVTLPSASTPAWTYTGATEGTNCSVSNGVLDIDTVNGSGGTATAYYDITDGANWTVSNASGYWVEIKCKVNNIPAGGSFHILAGDGTKYSVMGICSGYINDSTGRGVFLDTSKYHVYRLAVKGSSFWFFVDGVCVMTGASDSGAIDRVSFGDIDATSGNNIDVSIDYVRYYQPSSGEASVIGGECDTYMDDFAVFNTNITSADISALQLASVTSLQTFVDGSGITNIGRSHIAIQDLIDGREYEEQTLCTYSGYAGIYGGQLPIRFVTKKRVIPTIVLSTYAAVTCNVASINAGNLSVDGFTLAVNLTSQPAAFAWNGTWQAQCASRTKIENITDEGFDLVLGTPILDADGVHTGEYSKERVSIKHDDVETSKDGKIMTVRSGNTVVCIPTTNKLEKVKALGFTDDNLSVQSAKLVEMKIKIEKDKKDKA